MLSEMKSLIEKRMLILVVTLLMGMSLVLVVNASAAPLADDPTPGIQSVTGITTVMTFGQKVTAIAVEYTADVTKGPIEDLANLDTYAVLDSHYDFRFDNVSTIPALQPRTITRMYTNDHPATIANGVSVTGRYVIVELSALDYGGNTVRTNPASSQYIKVMTGTPDMKTQIVQNKPVQTSAGEVAAAATVLQPSTWLDPLADQFQYGEYCCQGTTTPVNLPYYYHIPADLEPNRVYPMVVILPGQGMGYYNGTNPIGANPKVNVVADIQGIAWLQPEWKGTDTKVIVLAPQSRRTGAAAEATAVLGLMDQFIAAHPEVDVNRLYFSTVSYGSTTAWSAMQQRPGFFASGLLTGGFAVSTVQATAIATARPLTPIYITHGIYDHILNVATTGRTSRDRLRTAYVATGLVDAAGAEALIPYQEYDTPAFVNQVVPQVAGYAEPDNHAVVGPTYADVTKPTWLLDQSKPIVEGPTIKANPASPTGYTGTFVYYNPNATQVKLAGDLTLLDINTGNTRYQPEAWQTGRYHTGGTEFLRDMVRDIDGYWSVSIPMHAGGLSYWLRVWDPTQSWTNKRIWDPTATHPRPGGTTTFRVRNNDVLGAAYVPYAAIQNDPILETRALYELPIADTTKRGTVQFIPYTTILGDPGYYLGVYLPAGYDANRAKPYKVVYLGHGIFGDETDWTVPGNTPNILDNMIARGEIEPTVFVTMGNHFTGTSLGAGSYNRQNAANNLVQTILPLIEGTYNVSDEREGRAYAGFSYGGSTGGFVMNSFPTTFGTFGFFSGNPSMNTANYDNFAAANGANVPFVFLGNGTFEGSLTATNTVRDNFRNRGIPSETAQVRGAHDMMTAGQLFTIFARDYLWPEHNMASLSVSSGTLSPAFDSGNAKYDVRVINSVTTFTVNLVLGDPQATATVNGVAVTSGVDSQDIALSLGENTITIVVTPEDGIRPKTTTITVYRNSVPDAPGSANPSDGATNVPTNANLSWVGVDPDEDPLTYEVRFGITNPPSQVVASQSATSFDPPGSMASNKTYYWQVIASDDLGDKTASPVWSFTTASVVAPSGNTIYLSPTGRIKLGGIIYEDEDILAYDETSDSWSLYFDGSDLNLRSVDVNGFALQDDGSILMTFDKPTKKLAGMANQLVDDSDIVRFSPTSLGDNTAGTFEMYFDGSDVGLTTSGEDIDAVTFTPDGKLVIGVLIKATVPGTSGNDVKAANEDLLVFTASSLGSTTAGTWDLYVDGSDIHYKVKDLAGVWIDPANGDLLLSVAVKTVMGTLTVKPKDILRCVPSSLGETTSCSTIDMFWEGAAHGFGSPTYKIDAFALKAN